VLELLLKYPQARAQVGDELGVSGDLETALRGSYEPPVGEADDLPPGTPMVCPLNPSPEHCLKRLRQKGQVLYCAEHGAPLVIADSLGSKE